MHVKAVILVALLVAGVFSTPVDGFGSVNEAFKNTFMTFDDLHSLGESLVKIQTNTFMFSTSMAALAERLVAEGLHHSLADLIVAQTKEDLQDTYVRKTGIQTFKTEEDFLQVAACAYRNAKDSKLDYICLVGQSKVDAAGFVEAVKNIKAKLMRNLITLFDKFKRFHAFSKDGFKTMKGLGSAETQSKLTKFLADSAKNKQSAYTALYENKDDPFIVKLYKNGLTYFSQAASVESLEGVEKVMLDEYYSHLIVQMNVPANVRDEFRAEMKLTAFGSMGDWKSIDFIFKNSKGTAKYINVMCATDRTVRESDFLIADVRASFELGPDLVVTTSTSSAFFGLIKWTKVKMVKRPAEISENTIRLLFNFFKLAAFEKFIAFRQGTNRK